MIMILFQKYTRKLFILELEKVLNLANQSLKRTAKPNQMVPSHYTPPRYKLLKA